VKIQQSANQKILLHLSNPKLNTVIATDHDGS